MCGIVGLLVKNQNMRANIGELMLPMLIGMTERGPDSAGLAIFGAPVDASARKFSLYSADASLDWNKLGSELNAALKTSAKLEVKVNHAVLTTNVSPDTVKAWVKQAYPQVHLLAVGQLMDIYKDTGTPAQVASRYDFSKLSGSHLVGHTRMATESAITPSHAHPFTAGEDWCLVHNGSLSNAHSIRRKLEHEAFPSRPITIPKLPAASCNGACVKVTICKPRWNMALTSWMVSTPC